MLIISLQSIGKRLVFVILFVGLLFIVSGGYQWMAQLIAPLKSSPLPRGEAVKVSTTEEYTWESSSIIDRLRLFYWYGQ